MNNKASEEKHSVHSHVQPHFPWVRSGWNVKPRWGEDGRFEPPPLIIEQFAHPDRSRRVCVIGRPSNRSLPVHHHCHEMNDSSRGLPALPYRPNPDNHYPLRSFPPRFSLNRSITSPGGPSRPPAPWPSHPHNLIKAAHGTWDDIRPAGHLCFCQRDGDNVILIFSQHKCSNFWDISSNVSRRGLNGSRWQRLRGETARTLLSEQMLESWPRLGSAKGVRIKYLSFYVISMET